MSIDIITQKGCDVKKEISDLNLLNLVKKRNKLNSLKNIFKKKWMSDSEISDFNIKEALQTPNWIEEKSFQISEWENEVLILNNLWKKCVDCSICKNKEFWCIDFISYPISDKCEGWLVGIVNDSVKKWKPFSLMIDFIKENIDWNDIKTLRSVDGQYLESNNGYDIVVKKWFFKKEKIHSNQLLQATFFQWTMNSTHMSYLLQLFGWIMTSEIKPENKISYLNNDKNEYTFLGVNLPNDADQSIYEFYEYFNHLFIALINWEEVLLD